jgi:hypothetical protein
MRHDEPMSTAASTVENMGHNEMLFRVHARPNDRDMVSASVFADKLAILIRALKEADRISNNGVRVHDFKIVKLSSSAPTALLGEFPLPKMEGRFDLAPAIGTFETCVDAIIAGEEERARSFGKCATYVSRLASGSPARYGYGEIWTPDKKVRRVDEFMHDRAMEVISPKSVIREPESQWFKGAVYGSFDGEVRVVDTRGALPQIKLILSAGGMEIDCVCQPQHIEQIGESLNKRVRIYGRAIYDGSGGLPRRVDVETIELVTPAGDFARWKGAFKPFVPDLWDEGDE